MAPIETTILAGKLTDENIEFEEAVIDAEEDTILAEEMAGFDADEPIRISKTKEPITFYDRVHPS